jgi:HEAT repeat protein
LLPGATAACCVAGLILSFIVEATAIVPVQAASPTEALDAAQSAFDKKQYEEALKVLDRLGTQSDLSPAGLKLKTKTLLKLGRPKEALAEYDRLEKLVQQEDRGLLREVAVGFIVVLLKDMREQMRGAAYTALKELEPHEAVPFFEDGLSDGSGVVRTLVVESLGLTEEGRRSQKFRKALDDQAALVKAAVLKALAKSGDRSVLPLLEQGLKDEQAAVRLASAAGLAVRGRSEAWEQVRRVARSMNQTHPEERATALRLLGEMKDPKALPVLLDALGDRQPSIRGAAAAALGDLGRVETLPRLQQMLQDKIPAVRTSAAISLGELGDHAAVPPLKDALGDSNPVVQAAVVSALLRLHEPIGTVAPVIRRLSQQQDPGIRAAAGKALGRADGKNVEAAVEFLGALLEDPIPRPRIAAARSLGHIGGSEALPLLKHILHDEDDAVRATAGGALAHLLAHPNPAKK